MGAVKAYWEEIALREFGVVTEESLELSQSIAQQELAEQVEEWKKNTGTGQPF